MLLFGFCGRCGGFSHWTESDLFLFHFSINDREEIQFKSETNFKVAYTSGTFFEKKSKRYPIFPVQINYYQNDQRHK